MVDKVRTEAGVKKFDAPIGTPIVAGKAVKTAKKAVARLDAPSQRTAAGKLKAAKSKVAKPKASDEIATRKAKVSAAQSSAELAKAQSGNLAEHLEGHRRGMKTKRGSRVTADGTYTMGKTNYRVESVNPDGTLNLLGDNGKRRNKVAAKRLEAATHSRKLFPDVADLHPTTRYEDLNAEQRRKQEASDVANSKNTTVYDDLDDDAEGDLYPGIAYEDLTAAQRRKQEAADVARANRKNK